LHLSHHAKRRQSLSIEKSNRPADASRSQRDESERDSLTGVTGSGFWRNDACDDEHQNYGLRHGETLTLAVLDKETPKVPVSLVVATVQ
jgi:hypothetical protein